MASARERLLLETMGGHYMHRAFLFVDFLGPDVIEAVWLLFRALHFLCCDNYLVEIGSDAHACRPFVDPLDVALLARVFVIPLLGQGLGVFPELRDVSDGIVMGFLVGRRIDFGPGQQFMDAVRGDEEFRIHAWSDVAHALFTRPRACIALEAEGTYFVEDLPDPMDGIHAFLDYKFMVWSRIPAV